MTLEKKHTFHGLTNDNSHAPHTDCCTICGYARKAPIHIQPHYIAGSGEHGCLYDYCFVARTLADAVESLADTFGLGRTRKAELKRNRHLELKPGRDGASYCEITECTCSEPWTHDENTTEEEWTGVPRVRCNQCEAAMINGAFCHETGCPNTRSRYNAESGEWIKQRKCFECGCMVDADEPCCQSDDE